ncbi:MAG TPA: aminotransferase class V-fold PLP-dependent enzyme [Gaiellaceae bacterium]|nr:aminotransferase class V-fold PLP-dependent enzyme [Gaiellaceae bacterium]
MTGVEPTLSLADARALWEPERPYLNTASFGLPPRPAWEALQTALDEWRHGRTSWEHWNDATDRAREAFARLVGIPTERVAAGSTVSTFVGVLAAAIPDGARVVVPDIDFASLLFPFLVHEQRLDVVTVPLTRLADAVDELTDVVAFSAVQSSNGAVADLDAVLRAAAANEALTIVDGTQACGWLPLDASRVDALVCANYKWLMSPRGTAFLALSERLQERVEPLLAGWYAGDDPHSSYYGRPLRVAGSARRLDTSPAWFNFVAAAPALETLLAIGVEAVHEHDVTLANRFRAGLGLPLSNSAIVSTDVPSAAERLSAAGILTSVRAGSLRASFHLYNTEADVDAALAALLG